MNRVIINPIGESYTYLYYYLRMVEKGTDISRIRQFGFENLADKIQEIYQNQKIRFWGVFAGDDARKRSMWGNIQPGDVVFFANQNEIIMSAIVVLVTRNSEFGKRFLGYKNTIEDDDYYPDIIYFLDEFKKQSIYNKEFIDIAGYSKKYTFRNSILVNKISSQKIIDFFDLSSNTYYPNITEKEFHNSVVQFNDLKMLDVNMRSNARREQAFLRKYLFNVEKHKHCAICGKEYPVNLMVAGHIKKRSRCTLNEKLDYKNIVMPICKFGCDELYEKGYISVMDGKKSQVGLMLLGFYKGSSKILELKAGGFLSLKVLPFQMLPFLTL